VEIVTTPDVTRSLVTSVKDALAAGGYRRVSVNRGMRVAVTASGQIHVGHQAATLADLPRTLKSRGATPATRIEVRVARGTSRSEQLRVIRRLAAAGFPRVYTVNPEVTVSTAGPR
jgi:biopolymer transport protein ExbD